eukprot:5330814-Amphidinium_carterae.2
MPPWLARLKIIALAEVHGLVRKGGVSCTYVLPRIPAYSLEDGGGRPGMPTRHSYDAVVSKALFRWTSVQKEDSLRQEHPY